MAYIARRERAFLLQGLVIETNPVGAPLGNQNAARGRRWRDAVERAVEAWPNKPDSTDCSNLIRGLNEAAHAFVVKMMASQDIAFFREFGDRLDGKATQALEHSGPDGAPLPNVVNVNLVKPNA